MTLALEGIGPTGLERKSSTEDADIDEIVRPERMV